MRPEDVGYKSGPYSGYYLQKDQKVMEFYSKIDGLTILPISQAKKEWDIEKYMGTLVKEKGKEGYFVHLEKNKKVKIPIQICMLLVNKQDIHNIVVLEKGSALDIITGCVAARERGIHNAISEFFIGEHAHLQFTMLHTWYENIVVRPKAAAVVEKNGVFINNYISLKTGNVVMFPHAYLKEEARAKFFNLVYAKTALDIGSGIIFEGKGSNGEIVSKAVVDGGNVHFPTLLWAKEKAKGHVECKTLTLKGKAKTTPQLIAEDPDAELTHEASIGKVRKEELIYLMARGFSEEEAISLIAKGFLEPNIPLPNIIKGSIEKLLESLKIAKGG